MTVGKNNRKEHRTLVIKNFRNLAPFCAGNKDDPKELKEFITLNRSLSLDEIGGLVILVSANNCGKSNALDAIEKYNSQLFSDDDYTDFSFMERIKPTIGMNVANGAYGEMTVPKNVVTYDGKIYEALLAFTLEHENYELFLEYVNRTSNSEYVIKPGDVTKNTDGRSVVELSYQNYATKMYNMLRPTVESSSYHYSESSSYHYVNSSFPDPEFFIGLLTRKNVIISNPELLIEGIRNNTARNNKDKRVTITTNGHCIDDYLFTNINKQLTKDDQSLLKQYPKDSTLKSLRDKLQNVVVTHSMDKELDTSEDNPFFKRYGYHLSDEIHRYDRKKISQKDLVCKPDAPNGFLINLLNILGYDISALKNAYAGAGHFRHKVEKEMNKSLESLSDELNDLLNINEKKYSLKIKLERENIELFITYGDDIPLNLDRQSEGFRWLFDLFFNLLKSKDFKPGDIVLMDEFGNSLNCSTIKELTKKLRIYAKRNGITFVLATQHPMAVDNLHLDEVRLLVPNDDGSTHIINNFNDFGGSNNHDLMKPILKALTIGRDMFRTENRRTVFVEGVTDYFYLNSICDILRSKGEDVDIDFIPINGLGSPMDNPKRTIEMIRSIERDPIMFIDGDKAGIKFKEVAKKMGIEPSTVSEIFDGGKKEIEDLFSKGDAERLGIFDTESNTFVKSFDLAACISYKMADIYDDLDEETISNFKRVIDYIQNQ